MPLSYGLLPKVNPVWRAEFDPLRPAVHGRELPRFAFQKERERVERGREGVKSKSEGEREGERGKIKKRVWERGREG